MGDYRPNTCDYCQTDTWCERRKNGKWQCRACEAERFFELVLFAPIKFRLLPWQRKSIRDVYGTIDQATGRRQYQKTLEETAKKNGKSFKIGGAPIYHLVVEADRLDNPKAFGAAAAKKQAELVFDSACRLVKGNPDLQSRLRILSSKKIIRRDGHGTYEVLSADGDVQDGIEPSLNIIDELHRWKTAKAHTLYTVMTKGVISQPEPLTVQITTAGAEGESPIWSEEHDAAVQKLRGEFEDPRLYVSIYSADEKRLENEPAYWESLEARLAANPSHENLGGFLKDESLIGELRKAQRDPVKRAEYIRYHLNVKVSSVQENAIDMVAWRECGGGVDLRQWPDFHDDELRLLISKWGLVDRPCYAGIDAGWTTDMTGLVLIFPPDVVGDEDEGEWTILPFAYTPEGQLERLTRQTKRPELARWAEQGFITATSGNAVDFRELKKRLEWAAEMFELREIGFDPWSMKATAAAWIDDNLNCIEVLQNFAQLSAPTKKLFEVMKCRKLRHGNHPVLNWHASCLALQGDRKDNVQPAKPARDKSAKRIDLIAASITGINRALLSAPRTFAYTGLRSVG